MRFDLPEEALISKPNTFLNHTCRAVPEKDVLGCDSAAAGP